MTEWGGGNFASFIVLSSSTHEQDSMRRLCGTGQYQRLPIFGMSVNSTRKYTMKRALRAAVDALGGSKVVGHELWPTREFSDAERRLDHCLELDRKERLAIEEIDWIFDHAAAIGEHEALQGWCRGRGYSATPTAIELALSEARANALAAKQAAEESARDLQTLIDNPRLLAQLRAAHVKVDL